MGLSRSCILLNIMVAPLSYFNWLSLGQMRCPHSHCIIIYLYMHQAATSVNVDRCRKNGDSFENKSCNNQGHSLCCKNGESFALIWFILLSCAGAHTSSLRVKTASRGCESSDKTDHNDKSHRNKSRSNQGHSRCRKNGDGFALNWFILLSRAGAHTPSL